MFDGLIAFGHSLASFLDPLSIGLILLSSLVGTMQQARAILRRGEDVRLGMLSL